MNIIEQFLADNPLEEHDLQQGTHEWLEFRRNHDGSSEAAAALGLSNTSMRNEMLHAKSSGVEKEFSDYVQKYILNPGHEVEALARPIVEQQFGIKLYPLVCSRGRLSASCDGLVMAGTVGWEHKQWNEALADAVRACELPDTRMPQVQQQLLVTGAEKWIFTVSNGTAEKMVSMEILPDPAWFVRILNGWAQFNKDRETHVPKVIAEKPKAEAILNLPALSVQATGMVTYSNLPEFKAAADHYIANINTDLQTDQDFANAENEVKFCKRTEEELEVQKKSILAQTATIDEVIRTVDHIQAQLRDKRLMLDKLVKSEKEARKSAMVNDTALAWRIHVADIKKEILGVDICALITAPNFSAAIKGLKSLASMHDALDTALANSKIEADSVAKDVRAKLAWCKENAAGMSLLFPDLQQIISKPMDDFTLTITSRIKEHKEAEERKVAAIRAKAEADAAAKLEAERAAMQAEEEAKARAKVEVEAAKNTPPIEASGNASAVARPAAASQTEHAAPAISVVQLPSRHPRPTDAEIIEALALNFRVHESKVIEWLLDMDMNEACERMAKEFA